MNLRFDAIFYYVSDLDRAIAFYTGVLGFRLVSRDQVARFDLDGVLFELVPAPLAAAPPGGGNARLCLRVPSVAETLAELRSQAVPTGPPEPKANGILASFRDPDGNELCLWEYAPAAA